LNHINGSENTPAEGAVGFGQFDLALQLLEAGADYKIRASKKSSRQLIHDVVTREKSLPRYSEKQRAGYMKLLAWLKDRGVDVEAVRADIARWSDPGS
jgi:hypothetical protein